MKNLTILLVCATLLIACHKKSDKKLEAKNDNQSEQAQNIEIEIKKLNESGLDQLIAQRNGKFLFLNVWATWCVPCREEFPDLVKLAYVYKNTDVEIVGLSVDYPDEIESKIIPFLRQNKVNFQNYVQNFESQENLISKLNKNWGGAIPATFVFDTMGVQKSFLSGPHDYEQFKDEIEKIRK